MSRVVLYDPGDNDLGFLADSLDADRYAVSIVRGSTDYVRDIAAVDPECVIVYLDGHPELAGLIRGISGDTRLRDVPLLAVHDEKSGLQPEEAVSNGAMQILRTPLQVELLNANVGSMIRYRQQLLGLLDRKRSDPEGEELLKGQQVQQSMLPPAGMQTGSFRLASRLIPGGRLCGDYQDYRLLDQNRLAILQADVSGNGFVTAMVASRIKGWFDDNVALCETPDAFLRGLNTAMLSFGEHFQISTAVCLLIDLSKRRLRIANAGHRNSYWLNRDTAEFVSIPSSGPALGMFDSYEIDTVELQLGWSSNRLVLFTDGLVEFKQDDSRWLSEEQFRDQVMRSGLELDADEYCDMLLKRSRELTEHGQWRDDVSLITVDFS
ncbi:MAG: serine/threonine-protein phosphatase [Planctomycetales bacterium]|nr:serine/threonine-protein phosphatase [bacterium]UNM08498.1 MAG: serine/threonine-protein phosphatase [Planctomycetales bacterium]